MTLEFISSDLEVANFTREMIMNHPESYTSKLCLLNNYFNILHLALLQISIPSLAYSQVLLMTILIALELLFILLTIYPFFCHSKFISWFELIVRFLKCILMVVFLAVGLLISLSSGRQKMPVNQNFQNVGILAICAGIALFYVVMILKGINWVVDVLKEFCCSKNQKENKVNVVGRRGLLVYQEGLVFYNIDKEDPNQNFEVIMSGPSSRRADFELANKKIKLAQNPISRNRKSENNKKQENKNPLSLFFDSSAKNRSGENRPKKQTRKKKKSNLKKNRKRKKKTANRKN